MMNSLLPNMRLLGLNSSHGGKDFEELCLEIDRAREGLGFDLAEEAVYFFYTDFPQECFVARSVTGPLKDTGTLILRDWVAAPLHRELLQGRAWREITRELSVLMNDSRFKGKKTALRLSRKVKNDHLSLCVEGLVHE